MQSLQLSSSLEIVAHRLKVEQVVATCMATRVRLCDASRRALCLSGLGLPSCAFQGHTAYKGVM